MLTKRIIFISAQPDVPYFHWQVEVQINNFLDKGIDPSMIHVLWACDGPPSYQVLALGDKYWNVGFFYYLKTVKNNYGYIPILRPDVLEQHFAANPQLEKETIFYHDSDIIFRELPNFDLLCSDNIWYLSNTVSYIGANYIKSKSEDLFMELCSIVKISPELVERFQEDSGGAQYLLKGVNSEFWKTVKEDALAIYKYMAEREARDRKLMTANRDDLSGYNPIQKWCSDMWAVLWGIWKLGAKTMVTEELNFSWGTSSLTDYYNAKIMHNAGVLDSMQHELFYKGAYINQNPFEHDLSYVKRDSASYKYVEAIQRVSKK